MYGLVYSNVVEQFKREGFAGGSSFGGEVIVAVLTILLLIVVQLFVVQWLWNTVLVKVVTVVKPLPSLMYTLGLLLLVAMVHPGSVASPSPSAASP